MSAIDGDLPAEKPIRNPAEGNIPRSTGPIGWDISWTEYAVQQAQIAQKTMESTVESAIEVARSRVDSALTTSSAHFNQTVDSLQDLKSEYITNEDIVFGKIKEGFLYASSRPVITTGAVLGVGFLSLKRTRHFLSYSTRRLFFSEETLLSRADAKVKELQQSIGPLKAESENLEKKAMQAEEDLVRGRTKLRQAGKQIQGVINSAYKIERQASGLKDVLRELPSSDLDFEHRLRTLLKRRRKKGMPCPKKLQRLATMGSLSKISPVLALYVSSIWCQIKLYQSCIYKFLCSTITVKVNGQIDPDTFKINIQCYIVLTLITTRLSNTFLINKTTKQHI